LIARFPRSRADHVVGEHEVDITQVAAMAIATAMRVADLARVRLSFPTHTGIWSSSGKRGPPAQSENNLAAEDAA